MKNLKLLFAGLVMVLSFTACSNDQEEVHPYTEKDEMGAFEYKSEHGTPIKKGDDR